MPDIECVTLSARYDLPTAFFLPYPRGEFPGDMTYETLNPFLLGRLLPDMVMRPGRVLPMVELAYWQRYSLPADSLLRNFIATSPPFMVNVP